MRKVLFLDIDGVLNNQETFQKTSLRRASEMLDPYLVLLANRIVDESNCDVVLSSSWRHIYYDELIKLLPFPIIDKTGTCCSGIRGVEIYNWMLKNISPDERNDCEKFRYAILDDDSDMLLWQKDSFFQTSFKTGLTDEIVSKVIRHFNQ